MDKVRNFFIDTLGEVVSGDQIEQCISYVKQSNDQIDLLEKSSVKIRRDCEQQLFDFEQQFSESVQQLDHLNNVNKNITERLKSTESDFAEKSTLADRYRNEAAKSLEELTSLRGERANLSSSRTSLTEALASKSEEINRTKVELIDFEKRNKQLAIEKCDLYNQLESIRAQEIRFKYEHQRWEQERELNAKERDWFSKELSARDIEILELKKEVSTKSLESQATIDFKCDEICRLESREDQLKSQVTDLTKQTKELNTKWKESTEQKMKLQETFEKELHTQTQLLHVYKQASEDADNRVDELTKALESVEQLCSTSKQNCLESQEELNQMTASYEQQLAGKANDLQDIRQDLTKANELLHSKNRVLLSEDELAILSPGAAAASRMMKGNFTLTTIYKQHRETVEELEMKKAEVKRLENYLNDIVKDIETKAPLLRKQRDDYREAVKIIANLQNQLKTTGNDQNSMQRENVSLQRQLVYSQAECDRYNRDNSDLSMQVRNLLGIVEKLRAGDNSDVVATSDDVALFRNIDELQSKNQELLSKLREAEAKREELIKSAQDAEMSRIKNELDGATQELEALRTHRNKQNDVITTISQQRDTYKQMLRETKARDGSHHDLSLNLSQTSVVSGVGGDGITMISGETVDRMTKEFDAYRSEKQQTEKMLNEKVEKQQTLVTELQNSLTKATADLQYHSDRFKILEGNVDSYKRDIKTLQEKNNKLSISIAKHEQTISKTMEELNKSSEEAVRKRVECGHLTQQVNQLKSDCTRMSQENQILHRNTEQQDSLMSTLNGLQARLNRTDAEQEFKLSREIDILKRERQSLQETVSKMTDQQQDVVRGLKEQMSNLKVDRDVTAVKLKNATAEMRLVKENNESKSVKLAQLQKSLEDLQSSSRDTAVERFQREAQQLQTRLNSLELRHSDANNKIAELQEQLTRSQLEVSQFKEMAKMLEDSVAAEKQTSGDQISMLRNEIAGLEASIELKDKDLTGLELKCLNLENDLATIQSADNEKESSINSRIRSLETTLEVSNDEVGQWKEKEGLARQDRDTQITRAQELEKQIDALNERATDFSDRYEKLRSEVLDKEQEHAYATSELMSTQLEYASEIDRQKHQLADLQESVSSLQEQNGTLTAHNESLHGELQLLTSQLQVMERNVASTESALDATDDAVDHPSDEGDASSNSEQSVGALLKVVRFLRDEKSNILQRELAAREEVSRQTARITVMTGELERTNKQLRQAESDAKMAADLSAEKAGLLSRLQVMHSLETSLDALNAEKENMTSRMGDVMVKVNVLEQDVMEERKQKSILEQTLNQLKQDHADEKTSSITWRQRHEELVALRATFDPEQTAKLRNQVTELQARCDTMTKELQTSRDQLIATSQTAEEKLSKLSKQLEDEKNNSIAAASGKLETQKTLEQARAFARKYKSANETKTAELVALKKEYSALELQYQEKEKALAVYSAQVAEMDELTGQLGKKLDEDKRVYQARVRAIESAKLAETMKLDEMTKMKEQMTSQVFDMQKQINMFNTGAASDTLISAQVKEAETLRSSLKQCGEQILQLQQEKQDLRTKMNEQEELAEEYQFRYTSLNSLHKQCDGKQKELHSKVNALQAQLTEIKQNYQKQVADLTQKMEKIKATNVAGSSSLTDTPGGGPVTLRRPSARAPTASVKPTGPGTTSNIDDGSSSMASSSSVNRVASIRPLAQQKTTAHVAPQAVSAVVVEPPVNTGVQQSAPQLASVIPIVVAPTSTGVATTFANSSTSSSLSSNISSAVPQAIVSPHFESHQAISSSNVLDEQPTTSTLEHQPVMTRKRAGVEQMPILMSASMSGSGVSKRARVSIPEVERQEQVQSTSGEDGSLPPMPHFTHTGQFEITSDSANDQDQDVNVESSTIDGQDDNNSNDEDIMALDTDENDQLQFDNEAEIGHSLADGNLQVDLQSPGNVSDDNNDEIQLVEEDDIDIDVDLLVTTADDELSSNQAEALTRGQLEGTHAVSLQQDEIGDSIVPSTPTTTPVSLSIGMGQESTGRSIQRQPVPMGQHENLFMTSMYSADSNPFRTGRVSSGVSTWGDVDVIGNSSTTQQSAVTSNELTPFSFLVQGDNNDTMTSSQRQHTSSSVRSPTSSTVMIGDDFFGNRNDDIEEILHGEASAVEVDSLHGSSSEAVPLIDHGVVLSFDEDSNGASTSNIPYSNYETLTTRPQSEVQSSSQSRQISMTSSTIGGKVALRKPITWNSPPTPNEYAVRMGISDTASTTLVTVSTTTVSTVTDLTATTAIASNFVSSSHMSSATPGSSTGATSRQQVENISSISTIVGGGARSQTQRDPFQPSPQRVVQRGAVRGARQVFMARRPFSRSRK